MDVGTLCSSIEVLTKLWTSIGEWFNYRQKLDEIMQRLRSEMDTLECRERDVNQELQNAKYQFGKKTKSEVENWLKNVLRQKNEVQTIEQNSTKRRYVGRSRFLKLVEGKIQEVQKFVEQGHFPGGLLINMPDYRGEKLQTSQMVGRTAEKNFGSIWKFLMMEEITIIGVQGMGGVGKTTVMTRIYNELLKNNDFKRVFWVTVSQEFSISKLQNAIAKQIKVDLSEGRNEMERATMLGEALRGEKFVVIFDDVWHKIHVEEVGIPISSGGGKLVITTRLFDVCSRMDCQQIIKVSPLLEGEAWDLFVEKLGRDKVLTPEMKEIAKSITRECGGLPLAIVTIAGSMRGANGIHEWRNVLKEMREQLKGLNDDMENKVYKHLKLSFDRLSNKELQQCFLYCALYGEDEKIDRTELIVHWIAEGFIEEMESRRAEYDKGHAILNRLENACLLESAKNEVEDGIEIPCVKMHDLIRDMALKITKERENEDGPCVSMVKAGVGLKQLPDEREWSQNLGRVSFMSNKLAITSISPKCPNLVTLLLQHNDNIEEIPNSFFEHMQSLHVLDLSRCSRIKRLPDSISNLKNLRGLFLRGCELLEYVPSLAELKELRELDLSRTAIRAIPDGFKGLTKLLRLDMSNMDYLESIPNGVLSNLSHLQSVRLEGSCAIIDDVQLLKDEFISLRQLEILGVSFSNLQLFNDYVNYNKPHQHWQRLTHYSLQIGDRRDWGVRGGLYCRQVVCFVIHKNTIVLPTNIQELVLAECDLPMSLSDVIISPSLKNGFTDLERCIIIGCGGIEHIWTITAAIANSSELPNLTTLALINLPDLTELFKFKGVGANVGGGIHVEDCEEMEDLVTTEDNDEEEEGIIIDERNSIITLFPNLRTLYLQILPKLKSICGGRGRGTNSTQKTFMDFPSLQEITVYHCAMLKSLPFSVDHLDNDGVGVGVGQPSLNPPMTSMTPSLKVIYGESEWWNSLEWDPPHTKSDLQPLFSGDIKLGNLINWCYEDIKHCEQVL